MKNRYPRNRKQSPKAKCPHCGGLYSSMGMGTHIREAHKMVYEATATPTVEATAETTATPTAKTIAKTRVISTAVITQDLADISGKDLSECKRPDGKHFYTNQDICILLAKIIVETYQPRSDVALFNQFNIMDLIEDFEHRFKCSFNEVRQVNQHIRTGETLEEHRAFAEKYVHLQYSDQTEKKTFNYVEGADSMGRYQCKNCGLWMMPYSWFEVKGYSHSSPVCINGERHEFSE